MAWITIDIRCEKCDLVTDLLIDREEQGGTWECPACQGEMRKTLSAPNITRASYVDGVKRKGFQDQKEIARLESEMFDKPLGERRQYEKSINQIKRLK